MACVAPGCDNGPIPKGYDVHHKDEDKLHNNPSNFELLSRSEHRKLHEAAKRQRV